MKLSLSTLRARSAKWVRSRFGERVLTDRKERTRRIVEEALELAQAEGVDATQAAALVQRVYARPPGKPAQETAGVFVCLLTYAAATGYDLASLAAEELDRIEQVPAEVSRARHNAKAAAGLALPSGD